MRYRFQLIDETLPQFTKELALACWNGVDSLSRQHPEKALYGKLYRAFRGVFKKQIGAYRYCGAKGCDAEPAMGPVEWHEVYPPDPRRVHLYIAGPEVRPMSLVAELLREAVRVTVAQVPKRSWKGLATALRRQIEKTLKGRVFKGERCGSAPLCEANEPYDPWNPTGTAFKA